MALMVKVDEVIHGSKAQLGERSLTAGAPFDVKAWRCIRTRARVVELAWEVRVERQHAALAGAGLAAHGYATGLILRPIRPLALGWKKILYYFGGMSVYCN